MRKQQTEKPKFAKVSEWLAAGGMESGFYCMERVERESEKAVGFRAQKATEFGRLYDSVCWMPRSRIQEVANDYYTNNAPSVMYLVPAWLYRAKTDEGFEL